jgi:hypothetical protein
MEEALRYAAPLAESMSAIHDAGRARGGVTPESIVLTPAAHVAHAERSARSDRSGARRTTGKYRPSQPARGVPGAEWSGERRIGLRSCGARSRHRKNAPRSP